MDWSKVDWFAFFPPLFSIYSLFISDLAKWYLKNQVERAVERKAIVGNDTFVGNLASGWATMLGFISAMIASFVSTISVWSASQSFIGVAMTFILLLFLFAPMIWYIFSHEPDEIESVTRVWRGRSFTAAKMCKIVLLIINIILIFAIGISQQSS